MIKTARAAIAIAAVMTLASAPAHADCHCAAGSTSGSISAGATNAQPAYRGGGYSASSERGVQVLRGKVPLRLNRKAAAMQSQAIAADRAAFTAASRTRAAQQRAASQPRAAQPRRGYRPAYSTLGRVFVTGPRIGTRRGGFARGGGARRGLRGNGIMLSRNQGIFHRAASSPCERPRAGRHKSTPAQPKAGPRLSAP